MKNILILLSFAFLSGIADAQQTKTTLREKQYNLSEKKLAIDGYDPVSYFSGKPMKGRADNSFTYQGVQYYFTSAKNRELFQKDPAAYEPQYGGWCAYAMGSDGSKVDVDPETFKIVDNKLYLFYNRFFNNTLKTWNKSEPALMKNADQSWKKFYQ